MLRELHLERKAEKAELGFAKAWEASLDENNRSTDG